MRHLQSLLALIESFFGRHEAISEFCIHSNSFEVLGTYEPNEAVTFH